MKRFLILGVVVLCGVAFAHHIPVGLSSVFGTEVLSEITYFAKAGNVGVPAYRVGTDAHELAVPEGSSFSVTDAGGTTQVVSFPAGLFADPAQVHLEDVAEAIDAQLDVAEVLIENESLVLHGLQGGSEAELTLTDGPGGALGVLGLQPGTVSGDEDIVLTLSVPAEDDHAEEDTGDLAQHPYYLIASTTPGETWVAGWKIPVLLDGTTELVVRTTNIGMTGDFSGVLNETEDATAVFDTALLDKLFPQGLPDELYFAYVVFNEEFTDIEFVSNRFDVILAD